MANASPNASRPWPACGHPSAHSDVASEEHHQKKTPCKRNPTVCIRSPSNFEVSPKNSAVSLEVSRPLPQPAEDDCQIALGHSLSADCPYPSKSGRPRVAPAVKIPSRIPSMAAFLLIVERIARNPYYHLLRHALCQPVPRTLAKANFSKAPSVTDPNQNNLLRQRYRHFVDTWFRPR